MPTRKILASNMKRLRDLRGWTQAELAESCGLSHGSIRKIETCASWAGSDVIDRIASGLNVPIGELFIDPDHVYKPSLRESWNIINEYLKKQNQI